MNRVFLILDGLKHTLYHGTVNWFPRYCLMKIFKIILKEKTLSWWFLAHKKQTFKDNRKKPIVPCCMPSSYHWKWKLHNPWCHVPLFPFWNKSVLYTMWLTWVSLNFIWVIKSDITKTSVSHLYQINYSSSHNGAISFLVLWNCNLISFWILLNWEHIVLVKWISQSPHTIAISLWYLIVSTVLIYCCHLLKTAHVRLFKLWK